MSPQRPDNKSCSQINVTSRVKKIPTMMPNFRRRKLWDENQTNVWKLGLGSKDNSSGWSRRSPLRRGNNGLLDAPRWAPMRNRRKSGHGNGDGWHEREGEGEWMEKVGIWHPAAVIIDCCGFLKAAAAAAVVFLSPSFLPPARRARPLSLLQPHFNYQLRPRKCGQRRQRRRRKPFI